MCFTCVSCVRCLLLCDSSTGGQGSVNDSKESDPKHGRIERMRIEFVIFYVDPKSVGSLNFLGKERVRFLITNEHSSLPLFSNWNLPD